MSIDVFKTPPEQRSFSALVDGVIVETGRSTALLSIIQYVNATIRECQALGLFYQDLQEDEVVPTTTSPYTWTRPMTFRSLKAAKYMVSGKYPTMKTPGRVQRDQEYYFYAADDYFAFNGLMSGETLGLATYNWAKPNIYYGRFGVSTTSFVGGPYQVRKAYYDTESELWYYLNTDATGYTTTLSDTVEEAARRKNAMHWLVRDWWELIREGVKAKVFGGFGDARGPLSFAVYSRMQTVLRNAIAHEAEVSAMSLGGENE